MLMQLGLKQTEVQATVLSQVVFQRDWAEEQLWVGGPQLAVRTRPSLLPYSTKEKVVLI